MTACSAAPAPTAAPSQTTLATAPAQQLATAWAAKDASAFSAVFGGAAPATAQAQRWFQLFTAADGRLEATGSGQLTVTTRFPGDRRPATESLSLTSTAEGGIVVVSAPGTPLWALEPARLTSSAAGSILTAADDDQVTGWLALAARAEAAVRASGVVDDWSGKLVLEMPSSAEDFALRTGSASDQASAVTSCRSGTPRIVVNPVLADYDVDVRFATLTHEAVHAATDSPCRKGLPWAVEGLAESVAAAADPATAAANRQLVVTYLASHPVPSALPDELLTPTDYALAQLAVDQVRQRLGKRATAYFVRATDAQLSAAEVAQATTWYREALRTLAR